MGKKTRGQKVNLSHVGASEDENLDRFAGHNYDEPDAAELAAQKEAAKNKLKSPNSTGPEGGGDIRHVAGTKAAKFGNFREESDAAAKVPEEGPYVAFIKSFGRDSTEQDLRANFDHLDILQVLLVSNENNLFCLIEFSNRDDLIKALMVSGTNIKFQYGCVVDVANQNQISKLNSGKRSTQRSPTSPKPGLEFSREGAFGQSSAEEFPQQGQGQDQQNKKGGMKRSGSSQVFTEDPSRESLFGSADPVPPPPVPEKGGGGGGGSEGDKSGAESTTERFGKFRTGQPVNVAPQSREFSREAVFGSMSAAPSKSDSSSSANVSPNTSNKPMFRTASAQSIPSEGENSTGTKSPNQPSIGRDMFGTTEAAPPAPAAAEEGGGEKNNSNSKRKTFGSNNNSSSSSGSDRFSRRSPNTKGEESGGGDRFPRKSSGGGDNKSAGLSSWRKD